MAEEITLRQMAPTDGPALRLLNEQTPDTGAVAFYTNFLYDPYETLMAMHPGTVGVVAEAPGHKGLVGMGLVTFGECLYEGALLPSAYMSSLSVHPDHRRRGIASRLAAWRVEAAHSRFGNDCVTFAGIQSGNLGSLRAAESWANERVDGRSQLATNKMRTRPPKPVPHLEVRPVRLEELEEVVEKQNAFYQEYNLYPPVSAQRLHQWLSTELFGHRLHDYYVAVGGGDNIVAGLALIEVGKIMTGHLVRMPAPLRLANLLLRIVPSDGVIRRLSVERLWFADGNLAAGRYLMEAVRWLCRERGTMFFAFFDTRSPLAGAITRPKLVPKMTGSIVLKAPRPMREDRLIYWQA
jgi:GNAT superfamily N-acetyltransferase